MGRTPLLGDDHLLLTAFDAQPTPIVILADNATVVSANGACKGLLLQKCSHLIGKHLDSLPIRWQDDPNEKLSSLLTETFDHAREPLGRDGTLGRPGVMELQVDIDRGLSNPMVSANLLVKELNVSDQTFHMLSFEGIRDNHVDYLQPGGHETISLLSHVGDEAISTPEKSAATSQEQLDCRFAQLRDAIYFNEQNRSGFLLSADETFCFPNYRGAQDVSPVEIDDIEIFFAGWDVWDQHFKSKLPVHEYPSLWLNRHRTPFRNRRYGLKEDDRYAVIETSGDPLYDRASGDYIGGVVWLKILGDYDDVMAHDLEVTLSEHRTICDRLPHLLWTVDSEGKADYFSQSWYDFTGFTEAESVGLGFQNAVNSDDMQKIWAAFAAAGERKTECHAEARYRRHDGQYFWMSVRAKPVMASDGTILKWYGSSTEINNLVMERLEAERQKSQIMEMLSLADVGLFEVDHTWQLNMLEGRMLWLGETQTAQLLDKLDTLHDRGALKLNANLQEVMVGKQESTVFEERIGSRWYKFRLVSDSNDNREPFMSKKVLGCSVDVTEQRERAALELENARLTTEASLEMEKSRLKSAFLAHMSHEIRTPIAGILGTADMLADLCVSNEQRDGIEDIQVSAANLLAIVNDILDISKMEAGKLSFEKTAFDLNEMVAQVKRLFSRATQSKNLRLESRQSLADRHEVVGDPLRLKQILTNLVSNAVKFTSQGFIELSVTREGTNVQISVEDTGEGIDEQTMAMLFQPFVQGDASTARRYGGTGLGLTISRKLAEAMGGTLTLQSRYSRGTKALLTVPLQSVDSQVQRTSIPTTKDHLFPEKVAATVVSGVSPSVDRPVLVVEDNAINQKIALNLVRKIGYPAVAVWNGQEALDYVEQHGSPSVILMDCQMPLMDGYTATRLLRSDDRYRAARSVPVIALTASAIQGDREKCLAAGMDDYLSKPVSRKLLQAMLEKWTLKPPSENLR